jgi:hypothetical protein
LWIHEWQIRCSISREERGGSEKGREGREASKSVNRFSSPDMTQHLYQFCLYILNSVRLTEKLYAT